MDAAALLRSQGWAGPGHSLDSRPIPGTEYKQKGHRGLAYDPAKVGNTGHGLVKPLAISQRKERLGIGKKSHEPARGNEWWLKGFESALGNIGRSDSERSGTSTPTISQPFNGGYMGKHAGLYGYFCRGTMMEGTLKDFPKAQERSNTKRKSDAVESSADEDISSSRTAQKTKTKKRRTQPLDKSNIAKVEFETVGAFIAERDKSEKRRRKKEKEDDAAQFAAVGTFFAIRDGDRKKEKPEKDRPELDRLVDGAINEYPDQIILKEATEGRRDRKRRKEQARLQREAQQQISEEEDSKSQLRHTAERTRKKSSRRSAESSRS